MVKIDITPEEVQALDNLYNDAKVSIPMGLVLGLLRTKIQKAFNDDHEKSEESCVEKGYRWEVLLALESVLPGRVERAFIDGEDLKRRINRLRENRGEK